LLAGAKMLYYSFKAKLIKVRYYYSIEKQISANHLNDFTKIIFS